MQKEFRRYLKMQKLKLTSQRETILKTFLVIKGHVSADELYARVKQKDASVGQATVFRFVKLLSDSGLAQVSGLGGKMARYEPKRLHHDHLVCTSCGAVTEFKNALIEREQDRIATRHGFLLKNHRMELYGLCPECKKQSSRKPS